MMKRKIILKLLLLLAFSVTLYSCVHDEINSSANPSNSEYTSKSLWKEDEVYIRNVMKIYLEHETEIKKVSGIPYWDYATTLESYDESFLMVPIVEDNKVTSVLQVPRHGTKVYFYYTNYKNHLDFFQNLIFSEYKKVLPTEKSSAATGKGMKCTRTFYSVWMPNNEGNYNTGGGDGHWNTYSIVKCRQMIDECMGAVNEYGECQGGGGSNSGGGYGYPGGGGNNPEPPKVDPCQKAKIPMTQANATLKNSASQQKMDAVLKSKIQNANEFGVALGTAANGQIEITPPKEGTSSSVSPPIDQLSNPNSVFATAHSHAGAFGAPSGGDMFSLLERMIMYPNMRYSYVYGIANGVSEIYALVINDRALAADFLNQYPRSQNYDTVTHDFKEGSNLYEDFTAMRYMYGFDSSGNTSGESYDKNAIAMAHILEKLNSGVSIAKADVTGNLKTINASIQTITKPNGTIEEKPTVSKCP